MSDLNMLKEPEMFVYDEMIDESLLSGFEKQVLEFTKRNFRPKEIANILRCDVKKIYNCLCRIKSKKY